MNRKNKIKQIYAKHTTDVCFLPIIRNSYLYDPHAIYFRKLVYNINSKIKKQLKKEISKWNFYFFKKQTHFSRFIHANQDLRAQNFQK